MGSHIGDREKFCYICAQYVATKSRRTINPNISETYKIVYGKQLRKEDHCPTIICLTCYNSISKVKNDYKQQARVLIPPIWREYKSDHSNCFFCHVVVSCNYKKTTFPVSCSSTPPTLKSDEPDNLDEINQNTELIYQPQNNLIFPSHLDKNHQILSNTNHHQNPSNTNHHHEPSLMNNILNQISQLNQTQLNTLASNLSNFTNSFSNTSFSFNQPYDPTFRIAPSQNKQMETISQLELNDVSRLCKLTKTQTEHLGSFLNSKNLIDKDCKPSLIRNRTDQILNFFKDVDGHHGTAYMNDISAYFDWLGHKFNPINWRLFIDASSTSLKAVLIHNRNIYKSVPIFYSSTLRESYENLKLVLELIGYYDLKTAFYEDLKICGDFKVINMLLGLQLGNIKKCCFLCEFDSRDKANHYNKKKIWPVRKDHQIGINNQIKEPLVNRFNIILPPLHIKLGLFKQFAKAVISNGNENAFKHLKTLFPRISEAKIKEGIFNGPQIRKLMADSTFETSLSKKEKSAWSAFKDIVHNFLGNERAKNFNKLGKELIKSYEKIGANMSLKLHIIDRHLDHFEDNCGDYSEEHGERFHQEIKIMESRYNAKFTKNMLADYCWTLKLESNSPFFNKDSVKKFFFNI